jgi:dTDP-4-amino-4,6-dideoxygalactose transaminase
MQFRDLKKQYQTLKPQMDEAVIHVMTECNFISGSQVKQLEARLAEYVGVKHCVTCANGTDALKLAEMVYNIGPGDAVFIPDFTFFATAETVADLGATPVFVDVDATTFNLSPAALEQSIAKVKKQGKLRPRAIVAVDLFGLCADYPKIEAIAKANNLILIEDGAQGFGALAGDRVACSFGDIATTSFFPAKPLGCYGDGGAIFTNDDDIEALLRSYCVHGKNGADKYDNIRLGMNSRLDTMQAAVLNVKLDAFINNELADVNRAATLYTQKLAGHVETPVIPAGFTSSWAAYTVKFKNKAARDNAQAALKAQGIPTMLYYTKCMHQQGALATFPFDNDCPTAIALCDLVLQLPIHPYLIENDIEKVCDVVLATLK